MSSEPEKFPITNARQSQVEISNSLRMNVLERGPQETDGPLFLLIHGLASNARMWDGVGETLATKGYRSAAIDLRGHGRSDKPDDGYDFDTVCDDVSQLLDVLKVERAIFVGQSWGGNVVVHSAHRHPDRVIAAVPVDGGFIELGRTIPDWDDCAQRMQPPRLAGMRAGRLESAIRATNSDWPETGIVGSLSNFQFHSDGTISPWLTFERHMLILKELWMHRPSELFETIERPILFMPADSGDVSWTNNKQVAIDSAINSLRHSRVHWFRPAHHDLHAQHPERCAEVLITNYKNGFFS